MPTYTLPSNMVHEILDLVCTHDNNGNPFDPCEDPCEDISRRDALYDAIYERIKSQDPRSLGLRIDELEGALSKIIELRSQLHDSQGADVGEAPTEKVRIGRERHRLRVIDMMMEIAGEALDKSRKLTPKQTKASDG